MYNCNYNCNWKKNVSNWSIIFQLQLNYTYICVFKLLSLNWLLNIFLTISLTIMVEDVYVLRNNYMFNTWSTLSTF